MPGGYGPWGDRWSFTFNVTKPDGPSDILGPYISDVVGAAYSLYTPTELGTYTVVATFPSKPQQADLTTPTVDPSAISLLLACKSLSTILI